ncbi:hypothetical protein BT93_E1479 [Corymbia citriodora subsp. variegata]|nr:hypothetical protein BT93_E1479 [Corymbia citriodora subsp. variegata]
MTVTLMSISRLDCHHTRTNRPWHTSRTRKSHSAGSLRIILIQKLVRMNIVGIRKPYLRIIATTMSSHILQ